MIPNVSKHCYTKKIYKYVRILCRIMHVGVRSIRK